MKKLARFAAIMLLILGCAGVTASVFAQAETAKAQTASVTGELSSVDTVNSSVTIKVEDDKDATGFSNLVITVAPNAKITEG